MEALEVGGSIKIQRKKRSHDPMRVECNHVLPGVVPKRRILFEDGPIDWEVVIRSEKRHDSAEKLRPPSQSDLVEIDQAENCADVEPPEQDPSKENERRIED